MAASISTSYWLAKLGFRRNVGAAATCRLSEEGLKFFVNIIFKTKFGRRPRSLPSQEGNLMEMSCLYTFHSTHLPYTVRSIFLNTVISYTFTSRKAAVASFPFRIWPHPIRSILLLFVWLCWAFSSCWEQWLLFTAMWGLLIEVASCVALKGQEGSAQGVSCPLACGIFLEQGPSLYPLHWQEDS